MEATVHFRFARALRSRPYALLWTGQTISALGDGAFTVALAWTVVLLTGSATALAEVLIAQAIPRLLFLLVGGVVADRLPRRRILLFADGGRAVAVLLIATLLALHVLVFWYLIALGSLVGFCDAFFYPAYAAISPQLVDTDALTSANSLTNVSTRASLLIGPSLGALLMALASPAAVFALDGASFVFSVATLLVMRVPAAPHTSADEMPAEKKGTVFGELGEGFAVMFGSSWLIIGTVTAAFGNAGFATLQVSLPLLIHHVYGEGAWLLGALLSANSLGAIIAALVVGAMHTLHHRGLVAYGWIILGSLALGTLGVPALLFTHVRDLQLIVIPAAVASCVLIGAGLGVFGVIYLTVIQLLVPQRLLGRVSSIDWLGSLALEPVGLAVIGVLTDRWGAAPVLVCAGLLNAALCIAALGFRGVRAVDTYLPGSASTPVFTLPLLWTPRTYLQYRGGSVITEMDTAKMVAAQPATDGGLRYEEREREPVYERAAS